MSDKWFSNYVRVKVANQGMRSLKIEKLLPFNPDVRPCDETQVGSTTSPINLDTTLLTIKCSRCVALVGKVYDVAHHLCIMCTAPITQLQSWPSLSKKNLKPHLLFQALMIQSQPCKDNYHTYSAKHLFSPIHHRFQIFVISILKIF